MIPFKAGGKELSIFAGQASRSFSLANYSNFCQKSSFVSSFSFFDLCQDSMTCKLYSDDEGPNTSEPVDGPVKGARRRR